MNLTELYAVLYFEINLFSAFLVGIIRHKTGGLTRMVSQRNFARTLDCQIVFFLSDTAYVMIQCGILPYSRAAVLILKALYFFSTALMCYFWFIYFELLQQSEFVRHKRNIRFSSAFVLITAILEIINSFTEILFYVDEYGKYKRGPLFIIQYILPYSYVAVTCIRAFIKSFRRENASRRVLLLRLTAFPVAPAAAGVIQFICPQLPVACATLSMLTVIMYFYKTDEMISVDPLTHLSNRKHLLHSYEQWQQSGGNSTSLYMLLIDANKFKQINDIYGHVQGDEALVRIADSMTLACSENTGTLDIARYGGDEFVILQFAYDISAVLNLKERVSSLLKELNEGVPYPLTVSIGIAKAERSMLFSDLLNNADKEMYSEKEKMHACDNLDSQ